MYTQTQVSHYFRQLERLIGEHNARHGFKTERQGIRRDVSAIEFMLMNGSTHGDSETWFHFKHRDTRNYLVLIRVSMPDYGPEYGLYIPESHEPFLHGRFDSYSRPPYVNGSIAMNIQTASERVRFLLARNRDRSDTFYRSLSKADSRALESLLTALNAYQHGDKTSKRQEQWS